MKPTALKKPRKPRARKTTTKTAAIPVQTVVLPQEADNKLLFLGATLVAAAIPLGMAGYRNFGEMFIEGVYHLSEHFFPSTPNQ
jgi:hypothetical protein